MTHGILIEPVITPKNQDHYTRHLFVFDPRKSFRKTKQIEDPCSYK